MFLPGKLTLRQASMHVPVAMNRYANGRHCTRPMIVRRHDATILESVSHLWDHREAISVGIGAISCIAASHWQSSRSRRAEFRELRSDLQGVKSDLQGQINKVEISLQGQINRVEASLQEQINRVEASLQGQINRVEASLQGQINRVEASLQGQINRVEVNLQGQIKLQGDQIAKVLEAIEGDAGLRVRSQLEKSRGDRTDALIDTLQQDIYGIKERVSILEGETKEIKQDIIPDDVKPPLRQRYKVH